VHIIPALVRDAVLGGVLQFLNAVIKTDQPNVQHTITIIPIAYLFSCGKRL
jgi:hypothetical protein